MEEVIDADQVFVMDEGHVVIVARAMGIPVVGQLKGAVSMSENGDAVIVDGDDILVMPLDRSQDVRAAAKARG